MDHLVFRGKRAAVLEEVELGEKINEERRRLENERRYLTSTANKLSNAS
jgi:hypothetical protein